MKSADIAKAMIAANPDLKGFFGANEGSAIGVVNARQGDGQGAARSWSSASTRARPQIDAIKSGVMAGAITQNPVGIGGKSVEAAVDGDQRRGAAEEIIDTGFYWYDKTNIDVRRDRAGALRVITRRI